MACLALEDVGDAFELLSGEEALPAELISYFEDTHIGIQQGRGEQRKRVL